MTLKVEEGIYGSWKGVNQMYIVQETALLTIMLENILNYIIVFFSWKKRLNVVTTCILYFQSLVLLCMVIYSYNTYNYFDVCNSTCSHMNPWGAEKW